jgi:uncharacterized protein (TIGR02449 family)
MDDDLQALEAHVERLLAATRRLADENVELRAQLAQARGRADRLARRIDEARSRVESALARLPQPADPDAHDTTAH